MQRLTTAEDPTAAVSSDTPALHKPAVSARCGYKRSFLLQTGSREMRCALKDAGGSLAVASPAER